MSSFNKNGIITASSLIDNTGANILDGTRATSNNPWVLSNTVVDIINVTNNACKVTPGKTYYLTCKTDKTWATQHAGAVGTVAIWLYLYNTYNISNFENYNKPVCFLKNSQGYIRDGLWKYTIPSGYNMARVRLNTYSDGSTRVTSKFWDINLIPEEDFANINTKPGRIFSDKLVFDNIEEY